MASTSVPSGPGVGSRLVLLLSLAAAKTSVRALKNVPDRQDAASLGKAGLLLDTADSLLENGRDLGR
jgi:hypothetical protein